MVVVSSSVLSVVTESLGGVVSATDDVITGVVKTPEKFSVVAGLPLTTEVGDTTSLDDK